MGLYLTLLDLSNRTDRPVFSSFARKKCVRERKHTARLDRTRWRELRRETTAAHCEQLMRFRFRHRRQAYLCCLEERWAAAAPTPLLP